MNDRFSNAGDVLKSLFDKIVPEESSGYTGLFSGWKDIVGPEISMHIVPVDVKNSALILEADHPGWIQRLRLQQEPILGEISSRYPELGITRIKISVGNGKTITRDDQPLVQKSSVVEKKELSPKKTPSIAVNGEGSKQDRKFFELLEKMRSHGDS